MGENKEYISHFEEKGNINIAEEVIAALAAGAAVEADGVTGLAVSPGKEVTDIIGKRTVKGVKVQLEDEQLVIDVCVLAVLGKPLTEIGVCVQQKVIQAIESTTGFSVKAVNVHICGVMLNK